jgi:hypothetical protein
VAVEAPPGGSRSAAGRQSKRRRAAVEAPPSGGRVSPMAVDLRRVSAAAPPMAVDRRRVAAEAQCEIQSNLLKL